jgi:hypothetical protein
MATLSPTGLQTATYGTTGWNNIYSSNFQMINDFFNRFNLSLNQITFSSNITVDWSKSDAQMVTLTGNTTINFTNGRAGGKCILLIKQDSTGGRIITWGSNIVNGFQPSTLPNSITAVIFVYDSVDSKYIMTGDFNNFPPRQNSVNSPTQITPDKTVYDEYYSLALANSIVINNASNVKAGDSFLVYLLDNGTAQNISFGSNYSGLGVALPTTTTAGKVMELAIKYITLNKALVSYKVEM